MQSFLRNWSTSLTPSNERTRSLMFYLHLSFFLDSKRVWCETWYSININFLVLIRTYFFCLLLMRHQSSRTKDVCTELDCDSDAEHRIFQTRKRSSDQLPSVKSVKCNSPIHPHQDIVKCIEKLQNGQSDDATPKNRDYELIDVGKAPSESTLKLNSTVSSKLVAKNTAQWHPGCEKIHEHFPTQQSSMNHLNINNNLDNGNQQLGSTTNLSTMRSRTHTKSLSTRISSLKRESKTTRTLSIVMFR